MINLQLKGAIESLISLGETLDEKGIGCSSIGRYIPTANQIRIDLVNYCCFIIEADKNVSPEELGFLSAYFDYYATISDIINHSQNTPKGKWKEVPVSFQVFIKADKLIREQTTSSLSSDERTLKALDSMVFFQEGIAKEI